MENNSNIGELVRRQEDNYINRLTNISKYVQKSMYEDLNTIDAYLNSKHISGETDSLNREKPFFNIVTAAVNIWYRATDIDRSNIKIRPTKEQDTTAALFATVFIQDWMRREKFGYFLNDWGRSLARYGSVVTKFVEKEGRLMPSVVPWNRLIVDGVDFDANAKIEVLELTEGQLRQQKGYDQDAVERLCDATQSRENIGKDKKDNKNDYIKLYEVHGYLPLSYLTGKDKDDDTYVQQMHVISFVEGRGKGQFDDYTLISGREEKDPYMITHLIREDGQTLSIGAVQHLFQAQWMMNHSVKSIKDQLDIASKLIFQTSDPNYVGQNALTAIEQGDILTHAVNQPLTQLNNGSHDVSSQQSFATMWKSLSNEIVGISESMLGANAPSGTPWRATEALLQENHSLFELMTENKGLHIEDMFRTYVIPFLKKKFNSSKEIATVLADHDITSIDAKFLRNSALKEVNRKIIDQVIKAQDVSQLPTQMDQMGMMQGQMDAGKQSLAELGSTRFFKPSELDDKTWKDLFKDLEWDLEVDVTGESSNAKDDLVTLSTVFQTIADPMKQQVLQTPAGKFLFNRILAKAGGVSPLEIASIAPPPPPPAPAPASGPTPSPISAPAPAAIGG